MHNQLQVSLRGAFLSLGFIFIIGLVGCSLSGSSDGEQANYQQIKQMIADSLNSKEGRETLAEALRDPEIKQQIIVDDVDVKQAVSESILDPQNKKILENTIKDPKFAAEFATNIQKEMEDLLKSLLKDPEYRELMIEVFKEPDFQAILLDTLSTSAMRKQMQEAAKDAFTTPAARLELLELLRTIQQEELEIQIGEQGGQQNGEQNQGSGQDQETGKKDDKGSESSS